MTFAPTLVVAGVLLITGLVECDTSANCAIQANSGVGSVSGTIVLTQPNSGGPVTINVHLTGFTASGSTSQHGFHIHERGDLGNQCSNAGAHYNPTNKTHGAPTDVERHNGDLGNIVVDGNGNVSVTIVDSVVTLTGPYSAVGKAFVVHEMQDDLGLGNQTDSKTTGHAGRRLGCCTIVLTSAAPSTSIFSVHVFVAVMASFMLMTSTLQ